MKSRRGYLLIGLLGAFLILGLASAASVQQTAPPPPEPSGGNFVRRLPDYDSGWQAIDPAELLILNHNLGGPDTDDYVVDLMFLNEDGAHHLSYGGDEIGSDENGAFWHSLTTSTVRVRRLEDDSEVTEVRLRIWVVPEADYDSGWEWIDPEEAITLTHDLGGDADDYLVYMEAKDIPIVGPGLGVNHFYYGMDANRPSLVGTPYWHGFYWRALTTSKITVQRAWHDWSADRVRVRIWVVPEANYDTGWIELTQGKFAVFDHGMGGPNNHLYVDLEFKDNAYDYAINQWCYGGVTIPSSTAPALYRYGATWHDLSGGSITVSREVLDTYAQQVRIRIWAPHRLRFPLVFRDH
jgi:hypothetical protein